MYLLQIDFQFETTVMVAKVGSAVEAEPPADCLAEDTGHTQTG